MALTEAEELELLELEEAEMQSAPEQGFMDRMRSSLEKGIANYKPKTGKENLDAAVTGTPPLAMPLAAAPAVLQKVAGVFGNTATGRALGGGVQGGIQGALDNPSDRLAGAARGAAIGGAMGVASEGIGKLLTKGGDVGMQAAVGRKKYTPGVGTTLADEGIVGTKSMMTNQVNKGLASRAGQMEDLAEQATQAGQSINVGADALSMGDDAAKNFRVPGAQPSPNDVPKLSAVNEFVDDMAMRGAETPVQALARRRAAGQRSYAGREDPLQSLIGKLSKGEQQTYSKALKEAIPEIAPVDQAYGALARARKGLEAEPSIPKSVMGALSAGLNIVPGGSLGMSLAGQAATKGGQGVQQFSNPALRDALLKALNKEDKR
jgi:hypothetical protein